MADNPRIEELKRRVQQDPASIAFGALAEEYRRAGLFHDAVETCRIGLQRHPAYVSARVTLGRSLVELGEYDEATQELEQVVKAAPENLAAIRALADIHRRVGEPLETAPEPEPPIPASPVPLKPVVLPADTEISADPVSLAPAPVAAKEDERVPDLVFVPDPRLLVIEDLELLLTGITRAREAISA
jgi:tetratricopeptide (TPR) repeat protein